MRPTVIGYTVRTELETDYHQLIQQGKCHKVIVANGESDYYEQFADFLLTYNDRQLVVVNFQSMGLQLSQLLPALQFIQTYQIKFQIMTQPFQSTSQYLDVLSELASQEKEVISWRTRIGLEKAQLKGVVGGRPTINEQTISRIQTLYHVHRKSLREISVACEVSLGTVHKYATQLTSAEFLAVAPSKAEGQ